MVRPRLRSSEEHSEDLRTALDNGQSAEAQTQHVPRRSQDFTSHPNT